MIQALKKIIVIDKMTSTTVKENEFNTDIIESFWMVEKSMEVLF